jgi:predicted aspartyl protease
MSTHPIPLRIIDLNGKGCHIMCNAYIDGYKMNLIIDTGASLTVLDKNRLQKINPARKMERCQDSFSGIGTSKVETFTTIIEEIIFDGFSLNQLHVMVIDLSAINAVYSSLDLDRADGVIGGELLRKLKARIDYSENILQITL